MSDKNQQNKAAKRKEVTLDDVTPMHPDAYPAKHLKQKLDADREHMDEASNASRHDPGVAGPQS